MLKDCLRYHTVSVVPKSSTPNPERKRQSIDAEDVRAVQAFGYSPENSFTSAPANGSLAEVRVSLLV